MRIITLFLGAAVAIGVLFFVFGATARFDTPRLPNTNDAPNSAPPPVFANVAPPVKRESMLAPAVVETAPPAAPDAVPAPTLADAAAPVTAVLKTKAPEKAEREVPPPPAEAPQKEGVVKVTAMPEQPLVASAPPAPVPAAVTKRTPAKDLFAAAKDPANMATRSIGFYAKGCLAGGQPLPVNGPAWQAMRLSRNRFWGHPSLVKFIERFAAEAKEKDGWPGLLVGDMSMPRGGPMPFGHASHQVGLDVDIWYKPMPDHEFSAQEREDTPMESFLIDPGHINPQMWSPEYEKLLRRAVSYPEVARIFVNPAIKKWLCDTVKTNRGFLSKITPILGHHDHFHVRLVCPAGDPGCRNQPVVPAGDGCGKGLDKWIEALSRPVPPASPVPAAPVKAAKPAKQKPPITMGELPPECQTVLKASPVTASK
jgi:penicillin-insensitive murein endopeptidase